MKSGRSVSSTKTTLPSHSIPTVDFTLSEKNRERNENGKATAAEGKKGKNKDVEKMKILAEKGKAIKDEIAKLKEELQAKEEEVNVLLTQIGNIVHQSVPVSQDEENNEVVKKWGETRDPTGLLHHHHLLWMIGGYEPERGAAVSGHRAYYLKGVGVLLNQAIIQYAISFLATRGYTPLQVPLFMNKDAMMRVAQLNQFDEELYKVTGNQEQYLIATSEQPIAAYHMGEWIDTKDLPIRYAGISYCFRKEAGSSGKDTWGIFRTHQFEKVEQFCLTAPEKSWEEHEKMLELSEEFYKSLELPYRVVCIVSGELNSAAAKKLDLEGWFPGYKTYRELGNSIDFPFSLSLSISFHFFLSISLSLSLSLSFHFFLLSHFLFFSQFLVLIALIISLEDWRFDTERVKNKDKTGRSTFTCSTPRFVQREERFVVFWRTIKPRRE